MEPVSWKGHLLKGIIYLILGIIAIAAPHVFTVGLELIIGWLLVIGGVVQLVRAIQPKAEGNLAISLILAAIYLIAGIFLLTSPVAGVMTLTILLTAFFIVEGIAKIFLAFSMRALPSWPWFLISGLISLALAVLIILGWPSTARWFIGLLVGINLIILGSSEVAMSIALHKR